MVLLSCLVKDAAFDAINIDNYTGAFDMVTHLIHHGHRDIAIIKGIDQNIDAQERLRGYRAALEAARIQLRPEMEIPGDFSQAAGYNAVARLLALHPKPTALFASNDSMAIGAMSALRTSAALVPEDVALASFDDIPIARFVKPALSTVRIGISSFGALAVKRVTEAVLAKNGHQKVHTMVPTSLVIRESCGCTAKEASRESVENVVNV